MNFDDELYKEILLDHYRSKKNKGSIAGKTHSGEGVNPSCGDELTIHLEVHGEEIQDAAYEGMGCSICCASADMLCESVRNRNKDAAEELMKRFKAMLTTEEDVAFSAELSDLEAMKGVKKFPLRIKCALLPWTALEGILTERGAL